MENLYFLKKIVTKIYDVIRRTERYIAQEYSVIQPILPEEITFIHSEDLLAQYPNLTSLERETEACKEYGAIFVIGIGGNLDSGEPHDGRSPDYDDWSTPTSQDYTGLNGDIIVYNPLFERAYELSSMGIRVDASALIRQCLWIFVESETHLLRVRADQVNDFAGALRDLLGGQVEQIPLGVACFLGPQAEVACVHVLDVCRPGRQGVAEEDGAGIR